MSEPHDDQPRRPSTGLLATVLGGFAGFAVGAVIYLLLNPVLEASETARDLQGFLWNVVPVLTIVGVVLGDRWGARRG